MPPFARTCMRAGLLGLQAFSLVLLLLQPSSAGYMRVLLRFRMGTHSVPNVLGRRFGIPRDQRLCQHCTLHAAHDERHLLLECPAMQTVRDHYPALFSPAQGSMHLFRLVLWGSHISSWIVLTTLGQRRVLMMMVTRTQAHLHQPWRLYRRKEDYICSSRPGLIRWNIDIVIRPTHLAWQTIP